MQAPELVSGLIIQNANAPSNGIRARIGPTQAYWS